MMPAASTASYLRTLGALEGRIELEPNLPEGTFILLTKPWGEKVICSLARNGNALLEGTPGRRASVSGWVTRERETNRPLRIDDVVSIRLLPETEPGSLLRAAAGIAPAPPGASLPEDRVRRWRDEE